jgi:hypothetical protein
MAASRLHWVSLPNETISRWLSVSVESQTMWERGVKAYLSLLTNRKALILHGCGRYHNGTGSKMHSASSPHRGTTAHDTNDRDTALCPSSASPQQSSCRSIKASNLRGREPAILDQRTYNAPREPCIRIDHNQPFDDFYFAKRENHTRSFDISRY